MPILRCLNKRWHIVTVGVTVWVKVVRGVIEKSSCGLFQKLSSKNLFQKRKGETIFVKDLNNYWNMKNLGSTFYLLSSFPFSSWIFYRTKFSPAKSSTTLLFLFVKRNIVKPVFNTNSWNSHFLVIKHLWVTSYILYIY